jgi:hypothetical protein
MLKARLVTQSELNYSFNPLLGVLTMDVAQLVEISILVRVIVNADTSDDEVASIAVNKVLCDPSGYINGDNSLVHGKDEECPYDPEYD